MDLTNEQKNEVAKWFAAGASLDEIQKRLQAEFGVHMTYLDVRLLVAELPQPQEPEPVTETPAAEGAETAVPEDAESSSIPPPAEAEPPKRYDLDAPDADEGNAVPDVTVAVDALVIPGTLASGDVTFSDGTRGKWYLDRQGRLGLGELPEGYRPSQSDGVIFQQRLMEALQAKGLC